MNMKNNTFEPILKYVSKYRFFVVASIALATVSVAANLYIPILIGKAVDCIVGTNQVDFESVIRYVFCGLIVTIVGAMTQWTMGVCNNKITYSVIKNIRKDVFGRMQGLPISFYDNNSAGDLVSRVIADVDQFADGLLLGFTQLFTGVATIIGTLVFMVILNPVITIVVIVLTPLSFVVARMIAKYTHDMFALQAETRGKQTAYIDEILNNQKVVKAYSHENAAISEFDKINDCLEEYSLKSVFYSSLVNPGTRFVNSLVYVAVGIFGAFFTIKGMITVGKLVSFLSYANQYTKPFNEISGVVTELQNTLVCAQRVFEIIETPIEEGAALLDESDCVVKEQNSNCGVVEFSNVDFSYDKTRKLISGFNLLTEPGQKVAIVGLTGCGKTTLINLIMRFYDVDSGYISVDGNDVRSYRRDLLRRKFGMVLQETWIRDGSILDNIKIGNPDATMEEVREAARLAYADSFIRRLPDGYNTIIKGDSGTLSAGQRQLICIARVMLALPEMLILDEATSSIDTRTEQKIQSAFGRMMKGRTSFIVAHRLSTIQNADIILVMRDGDVIEQGNHESLLELNGFYSELFKSQFVK